MVEQRKDQRYPIVVDAVLFDDSAKHLQAELRDINVTTVSLGWIQFENSFQDLDGRYVGLGFEFPHLGRQSLRGTLRECGINDRYWANPRIAVVELDSASRIHAEEMVMTLAATFVPPVIRLVSSDHEHFPSFGFQRAWNMLDATERELLKDFFGMFREDAIGKPLSDNLHNDPNSPGQRVYKLLKRLLMVLQDHPEGNLEAYESACRLYADRDSIADVDRDRQIDPKAFGPSVSRLVRRVLVENWILNPGGRATVLRDLVDDVLDDVPGSFDDFLGALTRREPPPHIGSSENAIAWCSPSEDFEELCAKGVPTEELILVLGMGESNDEHLEVRYLTSAAQPLYKPCSVHAGTYHRFRFTAEAEEFGCTIGTSKHRGLREAVHISRPVYDCLVGGGDLLRR